MTCCGSQRLAVDALKAGAWDYIEKSAESIRSLPGTVQRVLREWNETLKRRLAEKSLRNSEKEKSLLLNNMQEFVFYQNCECEITWANKFALDSFNMTLEEIIGKKCHRVINNRDVPCDGCPVEQAMKSGQPREGEVVYHDGKIRWIRSVPVMDDRGAVTGVVIVGADITERKMAEEQLRFKTTLLEAQSEASPEGILVVDNDRKCVLSNKRFSDLWHIPQDLLDTRDDVAMIDYILSQLDDPESFVNTVDYLYSHPCENSRDGIELNDSRIFERYSFPLTVQSGNLGRIWFFRDITDLRWAENEIRESEEKYRALYDCSRDALMTIAPPAWNFTSCNAACVEMFRAKDEAELIKLGPWDVSPPHQPDGQTSTDKAKSMIETAIREGSHYFEWTHKRLNGEEFPTTVLLTRIEMNGKTVVQATVRDETERKKRENDLARLAAIVKQAGELVLVADPLWTIEYVNSAFENVTGFPAGRITGQNTRILIAGDENGDLIREIEQTLAEHEAWNGHVQTRKVDGTVFTQEASIWAIRGSSGEIVSLVSIGRDITRQLALERQLIQAQKLESIGQLAAGIAHEINTPMQYLGDNTHFLKDSFDNVMDLIRLGNRLLSALKEDSLTDQLTREVEKAIEKADLEYLSEEIPKAIDQSLEGIGRVSSIVRAMKEFSHPGVESKVAADLNKAIESTITVSRNEWKYVADMTTSFDPALTLVQCYPGELNQVILNLLTNAAHAIKKQLGDNPSRKGMIKVSTRLDGDWVEIVIADTGTGIPESIGRRVFDPFFTTKEVGKGTGQGLAICHSVIVEKHKGTITFNSQVGVGTSFIIRLPIGDDKTLVETSLQAVSGAEV
jgi:PAS domain S-box-containing protein